MSNHHPYGNRSGSVLTSRYSRSIGFPKLGKDSSPVVAFHWVPAVQDRQTEKAVHLVVTGTESWWPRAALEVYLGCRKNTHVLVARWFLDKLNTAQK